MHSQRLTWGASLPALAAAISFLFGLILIEVVLRAFPGLIDLSVLEHFQPGIRSEVAERLGLPNVGTAYKIPSEMRTDGGRPILLPSPNSLALTHADKTDMAMGATEYALVDQNGLCNSQDQTLKSSADVFMAGDSFTFCTTVAYADSSSSVLQEILGLQVYNLGVKSIGPFEYLELMKRFQPAFQPRTIVMNIYEGNDLRDVLAHKLFLTRKNLAPAEPEVKAHASSRSYGYQFVRACAAVLAKKLKRLTYGDGEYNFRYSATIDGETIAMNTANRDQDEIVSARLLQDGKIELDVFSEPLENFVKWARAGGIEPIVTYIPSMYTAYEGTVQFEDAQVGTAVRNLSVAQRQWFKQNTARLGVAFVDTTSAFQHVAVGGYLTHFPVNVHLTPRGHEIVAREIMEKLQEMKPSGRRP